MNATVIARVMMKEALADRLLYGLLIALGLMMLGAMFVSQLALSEQFRAMKDVTFAAIQLLGTMIALFYGCFMIGRETERKTLHVWLSKGVRRQDILLGKFLGMAQLLFCILVLMSLVLVMFLVFTLDDQTQQVFLYANVGKALTLLYAQLLLLVAIAIFFSCLTTSSFNALCFTLIVFLMGLYHDLMYHAPNMVEQIRGSIIIYVMQGVKMISYILPNFQCFDISQQTNALVEIPWTYVMDVLMYAGIYTALLIVMSIVLFERRAVI